MQLRADARRSEGIRIRTASLPEFGLHDYRTPHQTPRKHMGNERILVPLDDLGMVRVHGPDTTRFLQGQLSNDVTRLGPERALLAGYHNPQGRTIAVIRLMWLGAEDVIAVLPRELAGSV